jgi:hypothetical protein
MIDLSAVDPVLAGAVLVGGMTLAVVAKVLNSSAHNSVQPEVLPDPAPEAVVQEPVIAEEKYSSGYQTSSAGVVEVPAEPTPAPKKVAKKKSPAKKKSVKKKSKEN